MRRYAARKTMKIMNVGYGEGGASRVKRSMKGWETASASPREDIDLNLNTLRMRSRDLYMNSPIGASAIKTNRTNVIGAGLKLKCHIDHEFLGLTDDEADAWQRNTEREFKMWAKSKHCDALEMNDFYDQQRLIFLGFLMNGDGWCLFQKSAPKPWMPYTTRLLLIEADRISTPWSNQVLGMVDGINPDNGNRIISGVEIDMTGKAVAYWVCNTYPNNFIGYVIVFERKWTRVPIFGENTGQPNILQLMDPERAGQYRGVPYLAPVIEAIKQLTRYTEAEISAAVVSAFFTVFITSPDPATDQPLGSMIPTDANTTLTPPTGANDIQMGPAAINTLSPGEKVDLANPTRPNAVFDAFTTSMCRQIGAAIDIPMELLLKCFNASYSASRGALLEAWKMFRTSRQWIAKEFCQPVYEEWLTEAVSIGRVSAPGFFTDPIIRAAWCGTEWHGPAAGQLDPMKEAQAADLRIQIGVSNRQRESIELNGSDFENNVKELGREQQLMDKYGIPTITQSARPPYTLPVEKAEMPAEGGEKD